MMRAELDLVPAVTTPDEEPDNDDDGNTPMLDGRLEIVATRGLRVIVGADVDAGALTPVLETLDR